MARRRRSRAAGDGLPGASMAAVEAAAAAAVASARALGAAT